MEPGFDRVSCYGPLLLRRAKVACPSGLRSTPRKRVWVKVHREFESHRYRTLKAPNRRIMRIWGPSSCRAIRFHSGLQFFVSPVVIDENR